MPILTDNSLEFISHSTEQTRRIGLRLGGLLQAGDVICLVGDLGSGKTTFVQGITTGWGSSDHALSPTFVLVNVYRHPEGGYLHHLDAYRLSNACEAEDVDIEAMTSMGPLVIEWADRILDALPQDRLWVQFHFVSDDQRDLIFQPYGSRYKLLVTNLQKLVYGTR